GAKADFSLVDLKHPGMQPLHDPLRNLLHCAAERAVAAVYVDGACVMREDRPTLVDYDGALAELQAVQDFAVRRLEANDPRGRSAAMRAPLSLPVLSCRDPGRLSVALRIAKARVRPYDGLSDPRHSFVPHACTPDLSPFLGRSCRRLAAA